MKKDFTAVAPTGTRKTPSISNDAAGVLLFYKQDVLLAKRSPQDLYGQNAAFGGYWSPFGGSVEEGENPILAACRELYEESGLELHLDQLSYIKSVPRETYQFHIYGHELEDLFIPKLDFEHTDYGYFYVNFLRDNPSPLCPEILSAIDRYVQVLRP